MVIYLLWRDKPSSHDYYAVELLDVFETREAAEQYMEDEHWPYAWIQERTPRT